MDRIALMAAALVLLSSCGTVRHSVNDRNTAQTPLFDSHRGLQPFAPENTIASFEAAGKAGQWAIETDLRMSSDGAVVCIHDRTLDRTTDGKGLVKDCDLKTLKGFKCLAVNSSGVARQYDYDSIPKDKLRIPTMDEYLRICRRYGCVAFIELKDAEAIEQMGRAIRKYGLEGRCVISSSHMDMLEAYRKSGGKELIHLIFGKEKDIPGLVALGNAAIAFNYTDYSDPSLKRLVALCHDKGLKVCFRAVDTPEAVRQSLSLGVDYMPTNNMWKSALESHNITDR